MPLPTADKMRKLGKKYGKIAAAEVTRQITQQSLHPPFTRDDLMPVLSDTFRLMEHDGVSFAAGWDMIPTRLQDEFVTTWWNTLDEAGIYQGPKTFKKMHSIRPR